MDRKHGASFLNYPERDNLDPSMNLNKVPYGVSVSINYPSLSLTVIPAKAGIQ